MTTLRMFQYARSALCLTLCVTLAACHGILDVSDPTLIRDSDIANSNGANALRLNALQTFNDNFAQGSVVPDVAEFTDEWTRDVSVTYPVGSNRDVQLDLRNSQAIEALSSRTDPHLGPLTNSLWQTSIAIQAIKAYTPDSLKGDFLAEMYGIRGYLILQMAEDLCPGFPINDVADSHTVYGGPLTTDSAVALASNVLDSALKYVRDSVSFITLARVVKGRALLDQGKYAEAAAMVASVPTDSAFRSPGSLVRMQFDDGQNQVGLGDREGINGQPFVSAHDPRVGLLVFVPRNTDPTDTLYITSKGRGSTDTFVFASGIEARLIQAEVAAHDNDPSYKAILDSLRTRVGLGALVDPGTMDTRVDQVYSERAFWLFMTGRRLGDLRRLVKNYGRDPETVFPTGLWRGGTGDHYGTATSIPWILAFQQIYNPNITNGCTER